MLAGRYRLEDRVRTRPGGSLWRAVDETLDRPVLVQAFVVDHPHGPEIVDAARRAALVEDPRLQRVLAAGEERGTAYVVLERLPGRTLVELLGAGPLGAETARRIVGEAAQALDRAATRGLHHLRLRPTSLVVAPDGGVTVVGTAVDAAADGAESPNTPVATRSDAVGLVALLYAALTGRWPGGQDAGLARAPRVAGRPVPPGDLVAGVPNDLDTLCAVALGPHEDGPRTPGELAAQLSPWAPAAPLTDPRGLHIGGPARPLQDGDSAQLPGDAQPAETGARRTPAWGLRMNRRARTGPDTGAQPVVPEPDPAVAAPAGEGAALPAASQASAAGDPPATGGNVRPAWATVEELRRALRRTGSAVLPGAAAAGPAPGAGLPLAAAAPPAGAPLAPSAAPAGAPLGDAVPPPGPPTAAPAVAAAEPLTTGPLVPAVPAMPAERDAEAQGEPRDESRDESRDEAAQAPADTPPVPVAPTATATAEALDQPRDRRRDRPRARPADDVPQESAASPAAPVAPPAPDPGAETVVMPAAEAAPSPAPVRTAMVPPAAAYLRAASPSAPPGPSAPAQPVRVPAGAVPAEQWYGNGSGTGNGSGNGYAGGYGPHTGGLQGLDMFTADMQPADPFEPVAPFGPEVPLSRPPREQARLVLLILAALLVVVGVVAVRQLLSFHPAALITPGGGAPATPVGATPAPAASPTSSASASPTAAPSPSGTPVAIAGIQALDPYGDSSENNDLAARAIDNDPQSGWRSEGYGSAQFGGIKKGIGLALDLGDPADVTTVTLTAPGTGGSVELRSADSPDYDGSSKVAQGRVDGSGKVVLTPGKPVHTRYLVVWFTRAPLQNNGDHRVIVDEIDVR